LIQLIRYAHLSLFVLVLLIFVDIFLSFLVFHYSYEFLDALNMSYQMCDINTCSYRTMFSLSWSIYKTVAREGGLLANHFAMVRLGPIDNEIAVFFWAGLLPALWLLIYVLATALTRLIARAANQIAFTFWVLNVDKHPLRAIGFVAATLVTFAVGLHGILLKIL
jgi:hypothetical protein